jgi:hypothetical protein
MPVESEDVIPSPVDPDFECVRIVGDAGSEGHAAPPSPSRDDPAAVPLCPDGYVPRRRFRPNRFEGKLVKSDEPPERNPNDP